MRQTFVFLYPFSHNCSVIDTAVKNNQNPFFATQLIAILPKTE
jgi:hypothetical protein